MPGQRESYVYHIPMDSLQQREDDICSCSKRTKRIFRWAICFIPWCALLIICAYFGIHYDLLTRTNIQCNNTLYEKSINESIIRANLGAIKYRNIELKDQVKNLSHQLERTRGELKSSQDQLELYVKAINDLKENLNLRISTDALSSSADYLTEAPCIVMLVLLTQLLFTM